MNELSIVMCALNEEKAVESQIQAVLKEIDRQTRLRKDQIVFVLVDNGSEDSTQAIFQRYAINESCIKTIMEPERGLNRARNAGIGATESNLVILCDADDEVLEGWLESMIGKLQDFDLVGCNLEICSASDEVNRNHKQPSLFSVIWNLKSPWGGACGFRRTAWTSVNGFSEYLPGGGEEVDFFLRAQVMGFSLGWVEEPLVKYHLVTSPAKERSRRLAEVQCIAHAYCYGVIRRYSGERVMLRRTIRLLLWLATRAPKALISRKHREQWSESALIFLKRIRYCGQYALQLRFQKHRIGRP